MYITIEYATCVVLTFVAGALLFGAFAAFLMIQEGVLLFSGFVRALLLSEGPIMRPARGLSAEGR